MSLAITPTSPLIAPTENPKNKMTDMICAVTVLGSFSIITSHVLKSTLKSFESGIADKIPAFSLDSTHYLMSAVMMSQLSVKLFTMTSANKDLKHDQTDKDLKYRLGQGTAVSLAVLGAVTNSLFFLADQGYISSESLPGSFTSFGVGLLSGSLAVAALAVKGVSEYARVQNQTSLFVKEIPGLTHEKIVISSQ